MAENSKIEWTDHTMNFWIGCTEVSPACDHCYARELAERHRWATWGNHPRHRTSAANWRKPFAWNAKAARLGVRYRVFTNSLADFFDNQVPEDWRQDAWNVIGQTPALDWLILTKRPQNAPNRLPDGFMQRTTMPLRFAPWPNVWIGTTVENQDEADRRIDQLRAIPAAVRFLSCEPLLGPIELDLDGIHWVIAGGESGPHRRPMDLDWMRGIRDQCERAGVAFFGKQFDKVRPLPPDLAVREFPLLF